MEKQIMDAFKRYLGRELTPDDMDKAFIFACGFRAGQENLHPALRTAKGVLENVKGNINPELGDADELEQEVQAAATLVDAQVLRATPTLQP